MTITTQEILEVTRILLDTLENPKIELIDSGYIKIWHKDRRAVLLEGKRIQTIGDANDDIERMKQILYEDRDDLSKYDLERLGALLIQIGATL